MSIKPFEIASKKVDAGKASRSAAPCSQDEVSAKIRQLRKTLGSGATRLSRKGGVYSMSFSGDAQAALQAARSLGLSAQHRKDSNSLVITYHGRRNIDP